MGTNYYWYGRTSCKTCKRPFEPLHIGKSSAGWAFSLHVHPELGISSLLDWIECFVRKDTEIKDEYGDDISVQSMITGIMIRNHPSGIQHRSIDGTHCVAKGEGSWDFLVGDFS